MLQGTKHRPCLRDRSPNLSFSEPTHHVKACQVCRPSHPPASVWVVQLLRWTGIGCKQSGIMRFDGLEQNLSSPASHVTKSHPTPNCPNSLLRFLSSSRLWESCKALRCLLLAGMPIQARPRCNGALLGPAHARPLWNFSVELGSGRVPGYEGEAGSGALSNVFRSTSSCGDECISISRTLNFWLYFVGLAVEWSALHTPVAPKAGLGK